MAEPEQHEPGLDWRFILAIGLSIAILIGWQFLVPAPQPSPSAPEGGTPSAERAAPEPPPATPPEPAAAGPTDAPGEGATPAIAASAPDEVVVDTPSFRVVLTNAGGRVVSWTVKDFRSASGKAIELVPADARRAGRLPLAFDLADAAMTDRINIALYTVERELVPAGAEGSAGERIRFVWSDGDGLVARKVLTFRADSPLVDLEASIEDRGRPLPVRIAWGPGLEADDATANGGYMHYTGQAVIDVPGALPWRRTRQKLDQAFTAPASAGSRWAGLEEQYFAALIIPQGRSGEIVARSVSMEPVAEAGAKAKPEPQVVVAVGLEEGRARLYVGAKKYRALHDLGLGLENVVWFSSYGLVYWIARWLFLALAWIHDHLVANYGLAIILSTIGLRLVLFPLNQYAMVRMRKVSLQMQRIQPKIKAIQQKHKKSKDPQARTKMNEETMALYRKEGVNPLGGMSGCLPMLAQFPILIAFYNVLTVAVELRGAPFLGWIRDLTLKDPFYVTPLLMGATMFIQQKMTPATGVDPAQQRMLLVMPVIFTVMFLNLPSGLVLYWFINNLLGIGQQWLVNRHIARITSEATAA